MRYLRYPPAWHTAAAGLPGAAHAARSAGTILAASSVGQVIEQHHGLAGRHPGRPGRR